MHMADALISPAVGGAMWAVSAGAIAYCSRRLRRDPDDRRVPLMGVLGAFLFAAQMINFTIPATGSSGHIGGGLLLSILLGPHAAFLVSASVLVVQALFFADGGLLALGCNIFNLGFFPAFIAYPLVYKKIAGSRPTPAKITVGAIAAGVIGLQLGSFCVVLETLASGISSLPFSTFALLMQPIHLAIGVVEGCVTAGVAVFVYAARPEIMQSSLEAPPLGPRPLRTFVMGFLTLALVTGGFVSWFASDQPDGLEWALKMTAGTADLQKPGDGVHGALASLQEQLSFLPDYNFKKPEARKEEAARTDSTTAPRAATEASGNSERTAAGTSVAGLVGGSITLALACAIGAVLRRASAPGPQ